MKIPYVDLTYKGKTKKKLISIFSNILDSGKYVGGNEIITLILLARDHWSHHVLAKHSRPQYVQVIIGPDGLFVEAAAMGRVHDRRMRPLAIIHRIGSSAVMRKR